MIGYIIGGLVALALANKAQADKNAPVTHILIGVPNVWKSTVLTGREKTPIGQPGTWQNWQATKGTPVKPGEAQDVYAPATAQSDTKVQQSSGPTIIDPTRKPVSAAGTNTSGGGASGSGGAGGSASGGAGGIGAGCPIEGTELKVLGQSDITFELSDEIDWIALSTEKGKFLTASRSHNLYTRRGLTVLATVGVDDYVVTCDGEEKVSSIMAETKRGRKMTVHVPDGHLYFAGGILSHNAKPLG